MSVAEVLRDLTAEQAALDDVVATLDDAQWQLATPSPGWSITDQLGHLTYFDNTAALAITDRDGFIEHRTEILSQLSDPADADEFTLGGYRALPVAERLAAWRAGRERLANAAAGLDAADRVEWYGPSMSARSFLTARLMEAWAHGQDIVDTVAVTRVDTDRIRHIAQLGVITRGWSYAVRGDTAPDSEIRVELTAPSGEVWEWGPADASQHISGDAADFCRVVTQRRNVADTGLIVVGDDAAQWMNNAQAFAGAPTTGPAPGSHSSAT